MAVQSAKEQNVDPLLVKVFWGNINICFTVSFISNHWNGACCWKSSWQTRTYWFNLHDHGLLIRQRARASAAMVLTLFSWLWENFSCFPAPKMHFWLLLEFLTRFCKEVLLFLPYFFTGHPTSSSVVDWGLASFAESILLQYSSLCTKFSPLHYF